MCIFTETLTLLPLKTEYQPINNMFYGHDTRMFPFSVGLNVPTTSAQRQTNRQPSALERTQTAVFKKQTNGSVTCRLRSTFDQLA